MSVVTRLLKMKTDHLGHSGNPSAPPCEACQLLELLDSHREAMQRCLERVAKGQYSQEDFSRILQEGLGR